MGLFNNFPYTDFHRLNLDWILKFTKSVRDRLDLIDAAVTSAQAARDEAEGYATNAENSATEAASSRDIAYQAASDAEDFKTAAQAAAGQATDASAAAAAAQMSAQQSAQTAIARASAAAQSATAAAGSATTAEDAKDDAVTARIEAIDARNDAIDAKNDAISAKDAAETAAASVPSLQTMARRSNLSASRKLTVRSTYTTPSGLTFNQPGMVVMKVPIEAWRSGLPAQDIGDYWHITEGFQFIPVKPFETGYYPDSPATLDINPNMIAIYYPRYDFLTAGGVITHVILYALIYDVHNGTYAADGETVHLELITNAFDMEHSQNDVITDISA